MRLHAAALCAVMFCDFCQNTIYLVLKFSESDDLFSSSHWAVINDGRLLSTAALHMAIHSIVAHVQLPSNKPEIDKHKQQHCSTLNMKNIHIFKHMNRYSEVLKTGIHFLSTKYNITCQHLYQHITKNIF